MNAAVAPATPRQLHTAAAATAAIPTTVLGHAPGVFSGGWGVFGAPRECAEARRQDLDARPQTPMAADRYH
jgi:hypothetical protein